MTDLEWQILLGRDQSSPARHAYADWLEERGFSCQALTQRLLAGAYHICGDHWELTLADLPPPVADRARVLIAAVDRSFTDREITHATAPYRFCGETLMLEAVRELAKCGYDLAEFDPRGKP